MKSYSYVLDEGEVFLPVRQFPDAKIGLEPFEEYGGRNLGELFQSCKNFVEKTMVKKDHLPLFVFLTMDRCLGEDGGTFYYTHVAVYAIPQELLVSTEFNSFDSLDELLEAAWNDRTLRPDDRLEATSDGQPSP